MGIHATSKRLNIYFDLDGTLIDSRRRLYLLFNQLVPESDLSFDAYWDLKRNKINHHQILTSRFSYNSESLNVFETQWMENIEKAEWLAHDKPFEGVTSFLQRLKEKCFLYLITARQSENMALTQIKFFGWESLFAKVLVTGLKREKYDLISENVLGKEDWLVGDTGKDILTGKKLGIKTAAVLSGFLNQQKLLEYHPDIIVNYVTDLIFNKTSII